MWYPCNRRSLPALSRLGGAAFLLATCLSGACSDAPDQSAAGLGGGDARRGHEVLERFRCGACHTIAGVSGANGLVGPPLAGIATRVSLAGGLPNTPDNLQRWIRNPQAIKPGSVMPNMGIGTRDARDMSAYLYTLR